MEVNAALLLLITGTASMFCVAGYALACWKEGSASTRRRKSPPEPPPTPSLDARFAKLESEMAELWSVQEKNSAVASRLSARLARRGERLREDEPQVPPIGTPKSELRKFYGIQGKTPAEVAKLHANNQE